MRIECEVCSATYTIDDAQLSDQPIGAQCPYCGHVKLVRRSDARGPAAGPPFGSSPAQDLGFGAPPPAFPGGPAADLGLGGPPRGAAPPSRPAPYGGAFAVGGGAPSLAGPNGAPEIGGAPFGMPAPPPGGGPGSAWRPPSGGPAPGSGGADRFAALEGFGGDADAQGAKCQVCATPLTDEFDKVIGLCDVHQRDRRGADSAAPIATDNGVRWFVRSAGNVSGPMPLEDLRARIRQGEFSSKDEFSKDGSSYAPLSKYQEIAYLASLGLGDAGSGGARPRTSFAQPGSSPRRSITQALAVSVLLVLAFVGVTQRSKLATIAARLLTPGKNKVLSPAGPNPLKKLFASWRLAHPDVSGTSAEHLVTARARFLEDTWKGHQLAEKAYERALLLDEDDPSAIAGYVENMTIWKYPLLTVDEVRLAKSALDFAQQLDPDNSAVHRALASFYLARGELNPCRNHADKALERDQTDGVAKLILAGCYLEGNVQLSIAEAERALRLVPDLRRADRVIALAYSKVGRYASALNVLEDRMKADPKNPAVLLLYGHIQRELGRLPEAERYTRQAVDAGGDVQEAQIALGDLFMEEENYSGAAAEYRKASETRTGSPERASRALGGLAHAELMRQRHAEAVRLAKSAMQFHSNNAEAILVYGEAALLAGSATTAASLARRALEVRTGEPAALVLGARALAAMNARDQAVAQLEEAIANDPQDARLKGILAALFLSVGGTSKAYALMRQAAEIDPEDRLSRARVGPYALSATAIREAIENFRRSASEEANASVASSSMGLLYYHLGDKTRAQDTIGRALRIDDSNVTALLYDAQLALDRGDPQRARTDAERILSLERGSALGHLMLARALSRKADISGATEQYSSALRSNPGLLVAKVELAGLDLKTPEKDQAIQELARAYQLNPNSHVTRRLLFEAGY